MSNVAASIAVRDFGRKAIATLGRKGIVITGLQAIPDMSSALPYANAERGYVVNDNGTGRVWNYAEVKAALN